jgi:HEAT repeat protein
VQRFRLVVAVLSVVAFGCQGSDVPKEKYFSGEPVEHWLAALKNPDAKKRVKAAQVLGNVGTVDARSIPALIEAVADPDAKVREAAVLGLAKIGPPAASAEPALVKAAGDKSAAVRTHAATALDRVRGNK